MRLRWFSLTFRRKGKACANVFLSKVREVSQQLFLCRPASQILQYIGHRHPCSSDARLSASLVRLDRNDPAAIHSGNLPVVALSGNLRARKDGPLLSVLHCPYLARTPYAAGVVSA